MGYVKIKKASGYDLVCAENVKSVKLATLEEGDRIEVTYIGDSSASPIVGASSFVQADVDKIIAAINIINGASGPGIFPEELSQVATSVG
tara:strand:- start:665 stop:934 length:270 start_codon:yes stop_codon:yes gene_type:complete